MPNNHYGGSGNPGRTGPRPATRNTGFPAIFKLIFLAACLVALAAYIGNRRPASQAAEPVQLAATNQRDIADPGPFILKSESTGQPASTHVGDARISVSADGRTAYVDGSIGRTFHEDLKRILEANRFLQRVVITSGGGYSGPGLEAARLIRTRNLTVRVKSHCASMCVGLWAAAAAREMEPDAVIGLHQWRPTCGALPEAQHKECEYRSQFLAAHDVSYDGWLRSAGFSDRMLRLQESTAASDVAVFVVPQLWKEGVDFRVVDADGRYMSRDETLDFLQAKYGRRNRG